MTGDEENYIPQAQSKEVVQFNSMLRMILFNFSTLPILLIPPVKLGDPNWETKLSVQAVECVFCLFKINQSWT